MMHNDPLDRLRRANPFPVNATAPPISRVLERLHDNHSELLRASSPDRRQHTRRGSARLMATRRAAPVVVAVVVAIAVGVAALALIRHSPTPSAGHPAAPTNPSGGLPPVPSQGPGDRQAFNYVNRAQTNFVRHHRACIGRLSPQPRSTPDYGSPSKALISRFSVLTLPASASGPIPTAGFFGRVFVKYVRVAQRRFGSTFEVFPVVTAGREPSVPCLALEAAAVHTELSHAPTNVRALASRIANEQMRDQEYIARHPEALCTFGGGGGGCEPFLYAQARGAIQSSGKGNTGSLFVYLAPNGVAKITARYPAEGPATGFAHNLRSVTVTVRVINNLAIWHMASEPADVFPTIVWHAADGRTIRTVSSG